MEHWRYYNPQPQCDECGKFISYSRATLNEKSDGMPSPSPVEYWTGLCVACEARLNNDECARQQHSITHAI